MRLIFSKGLHEKGGKRMNDPDLRMWAELLRVFGHPTRLAILQELRLGAKCVSDITNLVEARQANVSQHLMALRKEGLVDFHEDGNLRCYYLTNSKMVEDLVSFLSKKYTYRRRSVRSVRLEGKRREEA
jgi:ArsR family transcriptional regulator